MNGERQSLSALEPHFITPSVVAEGAPFEVYPFELGMFAVNVDFQGVFGAPDFLARRALVLDAGHDVALLRMAPHAALQAYELATGLAQEPALH